jgi:Domain of Unknown Function (DUF1080)
MLRPIKHHSHDLMNLKQNLTLATLGWLALTGRTSAQEWESLFDAKTLGGWHANESAASFHVQDGTLACDGPRSHLFYIGQDGKADFKNFELSVEVKALNRANSSVYFHTAFQKEGWPEKGFEAQVINAPTGEGSYLENKLTGSLYGIRNAYKSLARDGKWFTMHVKVEGKRIQIHVNDVLVVDYVEFLPPPVLPDYPGRKIDHGTFALQCHDPGSKVFYRNLRVKRLPNDLPAVAQPALTAYDQEVVRLGAQNFPLVNLHTHLKGGLTLQEALAQSRATGIFFGVAVNCGLNFSVTNDAGINACLETFQGQPVFVGMQAEGREWVNLFSREAISKFDYVITDAMTIVDDQDRRMRLWINQEVPKIQDKQAFMEMLVDRTVKILTTEPINIYVNPTYLPAEIALEYDQLWTEPRMKRVVDAAQTSRVAIEINSKARLPSPAFLKLARAAGCKFTFGTNNTDREIGRLDYCFDMVKELGLRWQDVWVPERRLY